MRADRTLEALWDSAPLAEHTLSPDMLDGLPPAAARYLGHALSPGAPLATAARIEMHGEIRLGPDWLPFEAEQVLRWDRGFVWHARVQKGPVAITGADRWVDGAGAMRWRLLGIVPVMRADGPDITRSAAGRFNLEAIWLPAVLLGPAVHWHSEADDRLQAAFDAHGEQTRIDFSLDPDGGVSRVRIKRWGDPDGDGTAERHAFGGIVQAERTFDGVTVPAQLRVGWELGEGAEDSAEGGEFFRCTLDRIRWR